MNLNIMDIEGKFTTEFKIFIDEKLEFSIMEDLKDPTFNTLDYYFKDCYKIPDLLKKVYEAGKNKEKLIVTYQLHKDIGEEND